MDIAAILSKIPRGPASKITAGIVTMLVIGNYAAKYLDKGHERTLSPSVFAAICLFVLIFICGVYMLQKRRGDHGSPAKQETNMEQEQE